MCSSDLPQVGDRDYVTSINDNFDKIDTMSSEHEVVMAALSESTASLQSSFDSVSGTFIEVGAATQTLGVRLSQVGVDTAAIASDLAALTSTVGDFDSSTTTLAQTLADLQIEVASKLDAAGVPPQYINLSTVTSALSAKQDAGNYITSLTGDVTASGPGARPPLWSE